MAYYRRWTAVSIVPFTSITHKQAQWRSYLCIERKVLCNDVRRYTFQCILNLGSYLLLFRCVVAAVMVPVGVCTRCLHKIRLCILYVKAVSGVRYGHQLQKGYGRLLSCS